MSNCQEKNQKHYEWRQREWEKYKILHPDYLFSPALSKERFDKLIAMLILQGKSL